MKTFWESKRKKKPSIRAYRKEKVKNLIFRAEI